MRSNGLHAHSQISCLGLASHWPFLLPQLGLARHVKHPSLYSDVVVITVGNKHAFYSFAAAVIALFGTRVGAEDSKTRHFTCFEPLKLFESAVAFALAAAFSGGSMESTYLIPFFFYTRIF